MRIVYILLVITLFSNNSAVACTCAGEPYCYYFADVAEQDHKLIFKGKYLQGGAISNSHVAMQFEIEHVYVGTVITADSPFAIYNGLENTETAVWLLTGDESSCNRMVSDSVAIFALVYNDDRELSGEPFGYTPTTCENDYFPISEDDIVNLRPDWWENEDHFMPLAEFEQQILHCAGEGVLPEISTSTNNINSDNISIFPNPTTDIATIRSTSNLENWDITLMETTGKEVSKIRGNEIDLSGLQNGVYIVTFTNGKSSFVEKIVKI